MNKQQCEYSIAKAKLDAVKDVYFEYESNYMKDKGITRKTPKETVDLVYKDFLKDKTENGLANQYHTAIDDLKKAEDALIEYGLSIIPDGLADQIRSGLHLHKIRERFIDITFRIDTRQGKMHVKGNLSKLYAEYKED